MQFSYKNGNSSKSGNSSGISVGSSGISAGISVDGKPKGLWSSSGISDQPVLMLAASSK
jgi:hypothetical protein